MRCALAVTSSKSACALFTRTTLGYARLYDGTVAGDHYRAMAEIENHLDDEQRESTPPDRSQLLALVVCASCRHAQ